MVLKTTSSKCWMELTSCQCSREEKEVEGEKEEEEKLQVWIKIAVIVLFLYDLALSSHVIPAPSLFIHPSIFLLPFPFLRAAADKPKAALR